MSSNTACIPQAGDFAYFIHLHLDTVREARSHPTKADDKIYEVEGKPRPFLIIQCLPKLVDSGQRKFRVAPITSRPNCKGSSIPIAIGTCIDEERESFVIPDLQVLPENMVSIRGERSPVIGACDKLTFNNVVKIIERVLLRR